MKQGHRHTPNMEWGRKARKEEDRLRGLNNQAHRIEIVEQLDYHYSIDADGNVTEYRRP